MTRRSLLAVAVLGLALCTVALPLRAQARGGRPAATAPAVAANTRPAPANWLSDRREFAIGDVITLYVDDAVIASARRSQAGRDNTQRDLGLHVAPPGGADPIAGSFGDTRRSTSDQSGDMSRTTAFRTTVAVRITARNADGSYVVKGTRALNIDKNQQDVTVEGVLRPEDVTVHNEANGDRLADARITVKQKGRLGKTRGGIIGRLVGAIWP